MLSAEICVLRLRLALKFFYISNVVLFSVSDDALRHYGNDAQPEQ